MLAAVEWVLENMEVAEVDEAEEESAEEEQDVETKTRWKR